MQTKVMESAPRLEKRLHNSLLAKSSSGANIRNNLYTSSRRAWATVSLCKVVLQEANMATHPGSSPLEAQQPPLQPQNQFHAAPYCSDPECEHCKQLREVQELIRLHESAFAEPAQDHP
jgi:hypothetical protein